MLALIINDLSHQCRGFGSKRAIYNWAVQTARLDVADLASMVSDCIGAWRDLSDPSIASVSSSASFKQKLKLKHPAIGMFIAPYREAIDLYCSDPSHEHFYPVYQVFSFLHHTTLVDLDQTAELEEQYVAQEESLRQQHLPIALIRGVKSVIDEWVSDFVIDANAFFPKHGPGSVADAIGKPSYLEKYQMLAPDLKIKIACRLVLRTNAEEFCPRVACKPTTRDCRIIFVPKSMKTRRVISAEPATLMWFEQGLKGILVDNIHAHPFLKSRIDFRNQALQGALALSASSTRKLATVDLSAASDSIHVDLVKMLFRDTPLYPFLVALRSDTAVLPSGKRIELAKYAPMGSALTFPIQTLIFASIVEYTVRCVHRHLTDCPSTWRVYGDDIIVPDQCLAELVSNLHLLGFRVNEDKTYGGEHRFRESCGLDAYDGAVVTPMRISRWYQGAVDYRYSPGSYQGLCDMMNQSYRYGFFGLRRYLLKRKLLSDSRTTPFFSRDMSCGVYSDSPTNFRLRSRYQEDLQRKEYYAPIPVTTRTSQNEYYAQGGDHGDDGHDDIRYFHALLGLAIRQARDDRPDATSAEVRPGVSPTVLQDDGLDRRSLIDWALYEAIDQSTWLGSSKSKLKRQWIADWATRDDWLADRS